MTPFSILQPASPGLRGGRPPRPSTVQPVKSLPLKRGFHGSADCSDAMSAKQSSVTTAPEMPFWFLILRFILQPSLFSALPATVRQLQTYHLRTSLHPSRAAESEFDWSPHRNRGSPRPTPPQTSRLVCDRTSAPS